MRISILFIAFTAMLVSCKKDNFDEPTTQLNGHFVYKGEAIQVEYNRVPYEIYDKGFGKVGPVTSTIAPDGSYSHLLFDGDYKLIVRAGQGPFLWPQTGGKSDSVAISLVGNQTKDIEVVPYYMIRTPQLVKGGQGISGTFKLEKIITDAVNGKAIETVGLYVNKTIFVSATDYIDRVELQGTAITDPNNISMSIKVPTVAPTQAYMFARIGVKAVGIEDLIYSPVVKITL